MSSFLMVAAMAGLPRRRRSCESGNAGLSPVALLVLGRVGGAGHRAVSPRVAFRRRRARAASFMAHTPSLSRTASANRGDAHGEILVCLTGR